MHVKSVGELKRFSRWCGVVVRERVPAQVSSTSLDHGSKTWSIVKSPRAAEQCDVNIQSINLITKLRTSLIIIRGLLRACLVEESFSKEGLISEIDT
ncbi:hypothetical protein TNCV_269771 [Trichonephila clavipes]|nr:hypothetical protein TNCV_269771 [Trichonephila clavipes]